MKSTFAAIALFFLAATCYGQTPAVKSFYDKFAGLEEVTDIKLQGWVLKLASTFADEEDAEKILRKITQLRILIMENGNLVGQSEYQGLLKAVKKDRFEELMKIKEDGNNIDILLREKGDTITDVLILVSSENGFIMLSLEGALKFSDLNRISIDVEGGENFKKIPEKRPRA